MSYVKSYDVGITRLDETYEHYVHELPLLSFGDARNTFALSLIFQSKLTSNPFYIANGYKLNIQKRIVFSEGYPQSYEDGNGALVKLNRFGNKYAFDDGSQRIIRLINGQYILENPDYSTEIFNTSGNILSAKDKYGNTLLCYTYSSGKLVSVVYKNRKTVTFGYSNNAMQYIQYVYAGSTFKITFAYSGNNLIVGHYTGVEYHFDYNTEQCSSVSDDDEYTKKTLEVYSANAGEAFSNDYSYKNIATEGNRAITIEKFVGDKKIDNTHYSIYSCDDEGNVKNVHILDFNRVTTSVQFEKGKPAYSYEYLSEMFVPHPDAEGYSYYPGKVTFYNNEQTSGYQGHNDGIYMTNCNTSNGAQQNSYVASHNFSGMMTVSGWLKPKEGTNLNKCQISISGTDNIEKHTHWVTGLTENAWTYFSVSFYMEGDDVLHARTAEENNVIEACDFRLSGHKYSTEELDEYKDNLIKSSGVLIHTDSNGVDHPIPITDTVEYINGASPIDKTRYPMTINDLMRFKINQAVGNHTGEIYYNDGRGILLLLAGTLNIRYHTSEGAVITASLHDLAIGKMHSSKGNVYVTKTNFNFNNDVTNLETGSFKNSHPLSSEIYNDNLDLIKSSVEGVTTRYVRNVTNGLVEQQIITDASNTDEIVSSAVYDENDFLASTTDEFGVVTTYTTDAIWGGITKSAVANGLTVTDTFDSDFSTQLSRAFGNAATKKHEFSYTNGFLSTVKNDTLVYNMGYNADYLAFVKKNNLLVGEFQTSKLTVDIINEYGGETLTAYYPNSSSPEYTIVQKQDQYGRVTEVEGLIRNTYDIDPKFSDGGYSTREIDNGSAKLAIRQDLVTGNTTKYGYDNDRTLHIGEFDSSGAKVMEEVFTYNSDGKVTAEECVYDSNENYVQRDITYCDEDSQIATGAILSYSNKIGGTEKAKTVNTYDTYKRIKKKTYTVGGKAFTKEITYDKTKVDKVVDSVGGTTQYEYDSMGRISKEKGGSGNILTRYTYDSYGQLIREDNKTLDKTFVYEYNNIGNVIGVKTYNYTTGSLGSVIFQQSFGYNTTYPDRLTSFGSTSINYNALGCPTTYDGYTTSWTRGKLSKLTKGLKASGIHNYYYNYNAFGQRTSRSYTFSLPTMDTSAVVLGMLTGYSQAFKYDQSGRLVYESKSCQYYGELGSSDSIVYLYDESSIIGVVYTSSGSTNTYYFQRNLLGDVIGIYDTSGTKVGGYAYDAWGNCTVTLDTKSIVTRNPIRYRGYYYDQDTKLYYLNARYYCPEWRRFISPAQAGALNSHAVNGLHLYSYANNNPVNMAYSGFIGGEIANSRTIRTIGLSAMTEGSIISPKLSLPALPRWTEYATTALDMFASLAGVFETSIWAITSTGRAFSDFHYTAYGINRFTMIDQLTSPLGNVCKKIGVGLIFADIGMNLYNCIQQDYSFAQGAISVTLTAVKDAGIYYASNGVASAVGGYIAGSKLGVALGSWAGPAGMIVGAAAGIAVGYLIDEFGDAVISWLVGLFD